MTNYKVARIGLVEPFVWSIDPETVQWMLDLVAEKFQRFKLKDEQHDLEGNLIGCTFHKVSRKEKELAVWLHQKMCENGWELFGVAHYGSEYGSYPHEILYRQEHGQ